MVHKKYIKKGGKTFGPYLYENYREGGKTKTRYLGLEKSGLKNKFNKFALILGIIASIFFIIGLVGLIFTSYTESKQDLTGGELGTFSVNNFLKEFISNVPLVAFVSIQKNSPPEIIATNSFVCETKVLNYPFIVFDEDGAENITLDISDKDPFFISSDFFSEFPNILNATIWSRRISKENVNTKRIGENNWAVYPEIITAYDGVFLGSKLINLTILEINNPPTFSPVGVQTLSVVWPRWPKNWFYYDLNATDLETKKEDLIYSIVIINQSGSSVDLFEINQSGIIDFLATPEDLVCGINCSDIYNVSICVNDSALENPHARFDNYCLNEGLTTNQQTFCSNFSLTITDINTPPNITSNYPENNITLIKRATEKLHFNITFEDEQGTVPEVYWYVYSEPELIKKTMGSLNSSVDYSFACGVDGNHRIQAIVTDGDLNDSIEWNISVGLVECPSVAESQGGGGVRLYCQEEWGCGDWEQCKNLNEYDRNSWISKNISLLISPRCTLFNWDTSVCGFQERVCTDFNYCNTTFQKPGILKECYYTENPNCEDNIRNCHDDLCEVLIDCGGPCEPCPTCSDKIRNQGEEGVDCGGPCNNDCLEYAWVPNTFKLIVSYSLIILFILVLILIFRQIFNYFKTKKMFKESSIKNRIIRGEKKLSPKTKKILVNLISIIVITGVLFAANAFILNNNLSPSPAENFLPGETGFLANYGFFSSFLKNLGVIFVTGPILSEDGRTKLILGDDTDSINRFNGQEVYFYAEYNYVSDNTPVFDGICDIRFENYLGDYSNWEMMIYDGISKFEYTQFGGFNYKGEYNFEVNCTEMNGLSGVVNGTDKFIIKNSVPHFIPAAYQTTYLGIEDTILIHNFTENVTEPDINDVLTFSIQKINNQDPINYPWINLNSSTGILIINSTLNSEAQNFEISVSMLDDEPEGETIEFYFNIAPRNDIPFFVNLENKNLSAGDLFGYIINISDEENNIPFVVNVSVNDLFDQTNYSVSENKLILNFIPNMDDIGVHTINFSVMDNNTQLGNASSSQVVNFTVQIPIWTSPLILDYVLNEGEGIYLNLSQNVSGSDVMFYNYDTFPRFSLTPEGIIDFIVDDSDVGSWEARIFADSDGISSLRIFNFTINNSMNDDVFIQPLQAEGYIGPIFDGTTLEVYENNVVDIFLFVDDNDLAIPQKNFYDENLTMSYQIEGKNKNLFTFDSGTLSKDNQMIYIARFTPTGVDFVDYYNVTINVTDKLGSFDEYRFNITIYNREYDVPNITGTDPPTLDFTFFENRTSNITFYVNHTVQDNLVYKFYIDGILRGVFTGPGDNSGFDWQFTPTFDDETYGNTTNLTLVVSNPLYSSNTAWDLRINHTNAPVEFIDDIQNMQFDYATLRQIDLKDYFLDKDYFDEYYLQNVSFNITSNSSISRITVSNVLDDWTVRLSSSQNAVFNETFQIIAHDLDLINESIKLTNATSNYFVVNIVEPTIVQVPVPQPTSGGGGATIPVSLKIISPGEISVFEGERIEIPIQLINSGQKAFNELNLNVSAFKDGEISNVLEAKLDKDYFKVLNPKQEENLTLDVFFNTNRTGKYEILISAGSKSPKYTDWEKIYISLKAINESEVRDLILFTEEFIAGNPQCIEITEILNEAEIHLAQGNYIFAKQKTEEALESCKKTISQVSIPRQKIPYFTVSLYLVIAILAALIIGLIYYFIKRRMFQKSLLNASQVNQEKL